MKKIVSVIMVLVMLGVMCAGFSGCSEKTDYTVGICQLMKHDSLDQATQGFVDALKAEMEKAGQYDTVIIYKKARSFLCKPTKLHFFEKIFGKFETKCLL